mgnify:CR=1 FL=1
MWLDTGLVDLVRDLVSDLLRATIVINDRLIHHSTGICVELN